LLGEFIYLIVIYPVYKEYKWEFFKRVGSDPEFISMYRNVQRWKATMKLDLLMGLILFIDSGIFSKIDHIIDIILTIFFSLIIVVIFQWLGYFAVSFFS
jgi:hypothetical protein